MIRSKFPQQVSGWVINPINFDKTITPDKYSEFSYIYMQSTIDIHTIESVIRKDQRVLYLDLFCEAKLIRIQNTLCIDHVRDLKTICEEFISFYEKNSSETDSTDLDNTKL